MKKYKIEIISIILMWFLLINNGYLYDINNHLNDIKNLLSEESNQTILCNERELYLCPYCDCGLYIFSSSLETSVAQLRCHYCGFETPEVHINKPNAELECIKKCKENFKTGIWIDEDFVGK